ncbi:tyrosine-type recombinase/integrase [Fuchsiella alkaliacetigena]|uniref:tyrosine-type recombinase/integrase n=1 Tax=Fuchsiella alkaliacetigena TaxID=957042 RepID=UPI00200A95DF|nr:tyrosine-type recombinase/integrase [Fuchsiella alkaliacetigena]MCK8825867.1 tyrosine-type recombinase/integrase [Fuchsiella alkaliacetigena]
MAKVEPIRSKRKIKQIVNQLAGAEKWRDYALFVLGINFGLRIGDLLKLQVKNVIDSNGDIKAEFEIQEEKTKKFNSITINKSAQECLELIFKKSPIGDKKEDYLIYNTRTFPIGIKFISRSQAYRIVKKVCESVGLNDLRVGTHTLRKTFGYHSWKNGISIEALQEKFKHRSTETTRKYLGIEKKDVVATYNALDDLF